VVANPGGLHARAAVLLAELARRVSAKVVLVKGTQRADATEVLQILSLGALEGQQLVLEVSGEDAGAVLDAVEQLFLSKFGDDEPATNMS
jgi:phosphocarrier protein NPr